MSYTMPQIDPEFVHALMEQDEPQVVQDVIVLYTIGVLQGISAVMREHAMTLLLGGFQQPYVDGWLDAADTFDCDPPPRDVQAAHADHGEDEQ
jgi:hypothetical protein